MQRLTKRGSSKTHEINMTPMIDLIFLLLVFFIVTASFSKEMSIDIEKPAAKSAELNEKTTVMFFINADGQVFLENKEIDFRSIRGRMNSHISQDSETRVMVIADKRSKVDVVIKVMDQCRLGGVKYVSLAAEKK